MEELNTLLDQIRVPNLSSKVYKNECAYTFDNPESPDGLYVDMNNFLGFSKEFAKLNFQKTGHKVYLHIKRIRIPKEEMEVEKESSEPPKKKPTVLGIGVNGGFEVEDEKKFDIQETYSIVILPDFKTIPYPDPDLPEKIQQSIAAILAADAPAAQEELNEWLSELKESKYAKDLKQLDNGVRIPPSGWKCHKCDLTENLWLNLTDGTILCGRKNWDGTGGNGHALEHFKSTGFPLCVKLGTITPEGHGDVYSYAEEDTVLDPLLPHHLSHFGINVAQMQKTEKTVAEMEIDKNLNFDWSRLQEQDKKLEPLYGPGFTGMQNIGNSCYMASVMQTLFSIPEFQKRYFEKADQIFQSAPVDPTTDFQTQMAKLARGLLSGHYSLPSDVQKDEHKQPTQNGIAPRMLKGVVGKGHPEFSTSRQQDALEFLQYLLNTIERDEKKYGGSTVDPSQSVKFEIEEKIRCTRSGKVRYTNRIDNVLSLPIPVEKATNLAEVHAYEERLKKQKEEEEKSGKKDQGPREEPVRPRLSLINCFESFAAPEEIPDFYSSAINEKTTGIRESKIATFPDYLVVQLRKFYVGQDWTPKKLDVYIDVPDTLNLEKFRGNGLQPGEETLPENSSSSSQNNIVIDETLVSQLMEMGFPRNRCEKAVHNTHNEGIEQASNWLFAHMEDADIDVPMEKTAPSASAKISNEVVNEEGVAMLSSMGFSREQAIKALKATENNVERATEWIFSHMDDSSDDVAATSSSSSDSSQKKSTIKDGPAEYSLKAFISHMGTSTMSGHYVCHIKKEGKWVLFNDNKVALSEDPPRDMGYIYIFERVHK